MALTCVIRSYHSHQIEPYRIRCAHTHTHVMQQSSMEWMEKNEKKKGSAKREMIREVYRA